MRILWGRSHLKPGEFTFQVHRIRGVALNDPDPINNGIKKRLGGFDDEELRRIMVRAGAVRFEGSDGKELWGLISRNKEIY